MSTEITETRSSVCPQPVILTNQLLDKLKQGEVTITVDNPSAKEKLIELANALNCGISVEEGGGIFQVRITKDQVLEEANLPLGQTVYLITRTTLGQGSEELGANLMQSFFFTLQANETPPAAILFINSGVKLTTDCSAVLESLLALSGRGVKIMSCETSLSFYKLKEKLAVGEMTGMYSIVEKLENSSKVITL